jgi:hypothetical protein
MLLAERAPDTVAVVTLAGNLDAGAWTDHHAFAPLEGSLDPAQRPPLSPDILQIHHLAGRDESIPPTLVRRAIERQPGAEVRLHPTYDHRCCWERAWPDSLSELDRLLSGSTSELEPTTQSERVHAEIRVPEDRGFNFVINGDLKIQAYSDSKQPAETYTVRQNYLVERPPMSVFGLVEENATEGGVVWLEVTYAKETSWTSDDEATPIEQPNYLTD